MSMVRRTKIVRNDTPWPAHWQVLKEWDVPAEIRLPRGSDRRLVSRMTEVAIKGAPSSWLLFDKYVYNPANDKEWVDAFAQGNISGFTAFRPEQIVKVRSRVVPKKRKPIEDVKTDAT